MKKLIALFLLISSFAYGQTNNYTNTKFPNGLASGNGITPPTTGRTPGMLYHYTGTGMQYWDGSAWQTLGISVAGVTSFNTRTGAVTSVIGDYSSFYVTQGTNQTSGLTGNKTWSGDQQFQGGLSATGVLPLANNTYDIGDLLTNWRSIYVRKIANLTSNGLIKTTGADGTLSIATPGTDYGTVTSITPGWSFTSQTPITSTGTLTEDSTKVQTVLNFFPKGDTRYLRGTGTGVTSVSGTSNRITSTGGTTPVIDISSSYVGQSSITTLGTITTGVWSATGIGISYGGTGTTTGAIWNQNGSNLAAQTAKFWITDTIKTNGRIIAVNINSGTLSATGVISGDSYSSISNSSFASGFTPVVRSSGGVYGTALVENFRTWLGTLATSPIFYNPTTGIISSQAATSGQNGYLTSTDWSTFNGKAASGATFTLGSTSIALGSTTTTVAGLSSLTSNIFVLTPNSLSSSTNGLSQVVATDDIFRQYAYATDVDRGEWVFEAGDNGTPWDTDGERWRFWYSAATGGVAKDAFIIDYNTSTLNTNLITTDNTYDIGASGATRFRTGYFATSVVAPSFVGALTGNASTATNVAVGGITGLGTGVATALAINVGSAGAFITNTAVGTGYVPYTGASSDVNLGAHSLTVDGTGANINIKKGNALVFWDNTNVYDTQIYAAAGAGTNVITFPAATGTVALTSSLSSYLPLTGGTLSGTLNQTISGSANYNLANSSTGGNAAIFIQSGDGTTSADFNYISFKSHQTSPQEWRSGMNGSLDYTIRDVTAGTNPFTITPSTGALTLTGALTGTSATFSGNISAANLTSGTYTPTMAGVSNIASSTPQLSHYIRVANEVTVTGVFNVATTAIGSAAITISLPIASNLGAAYELSGMAIIDFSGVATNVSGIIFSETGTNTAQLNFTTPSTASEPCHFSFKYTII